MKVYSDDIVKPDVLLNAIETAFNKQNDFFVDSLKKQIKFLKYVVYTNFVFSVGVFSFVVYDKFFS